jgi:hypothetical protein
MARGDPSITKIHQADAIEALVLRRQGSLSADRSARDACRKREKPDQPPRSA